MTIKDFSWLEAHAIPEEFAKAQGVKRVGKSMVFPWKDGTREVLQFADDDAEKTGKPKYRFPKGSGTIINHIKPPIDSEAGLGGVLIVEGTKQSLALAYLLKDTPLGVYGIAGVNGWKEDLLGFVDGRNVMVAFDKDRDSNPQVAQAAAKLRAALYKAGAPQVGFIDPPGVGKESWDDILARTAKEARYNLFRNAVLEADARSNGAQRLRVTRASEIEPEPASWLWEPDSDSKWLPLGGLTLLAGREGIGKSTIAYDIAAKVTQGLLPGEYTGTPRGVIVAATEDNWATTVVPRLMAAGADLDKVLRVEAVSHEGFAGNLSLPHDVPDLERLIHEEEAALVLIDPLMSALDGKIDSHKDADVRRALEPISRLAHETGVSVIGLIHVSKAKDGDLMTRIMASRAFGAIARAVLFCLREEPEIGAIGGHETFLFGQTKNNLAAKPAYSIRYTIQGVIIDEEKRIYSSRIAWGERVEAAKEGTLQDIATRQENRTPTKETTADRAASWLKRYLEEHGPTPSAEVKIAGEFAGYSEKTLLRVLQRVGVTSTSERTPRGRQTVWSLSCPDVPDVPNVPDVPDVDRPPFGTSRHPDKSLAGLS